MAPRRLRRLGRTEVLGRDALVARGFRARLLGLALISRERAGPGLLIPRCRCVHTFGMRFPLDLVFIDREGRAVRELHGVPACRVVACAGAEAVLELPGRACTGGPTRVLSSGDPKRRSKEMSFIDKLTGRAKKAAGDLSGDSSLRREGTKEEKKGEAKDKLDNAQDAVEDKAEEVADLERRT
jgi:uncharacterized protein